MAGGGMFDAGSFQERAPRFRRGEGGREEEKKRGNRLGQFVRISGIVQGGDLETVGSAQEWRGELSS